MIPGDEELVATGVMSSEEVSMDVSDQVVSDDSNYHRIAHALGPRWWVHATVPGLVSIRRMRNVV